MNSEGADLKWKICEIYCLLFLLLGVEIDSGMASRRVACGAGDDARNPDKRFKDSSLDQPLDPVFASASSKPFLGSGGMLSFGPVGGVNGSGNSFYQTFNQEEGVDEYFDEYFSQPEKKRRLSVDQIQFLERNFEAENKLEPERKMQLAKELGLQPRQIAVWFQNRRARWKSRQLETDYEALRTSYDTLKVGYENLLADNEKLKLEVCRLRCSALAGAADRENSHLPDAQTTPKEALSEDGESRVSAAATRNEEQSSAKSDVTNVETTTNGICRNSNSFHALEFDESDISQNGEIDLNGELLRPDYIFPRTEDAHCHTLASSFYFEDQGFGFWSF